MTPAGYRHTLSRALLYQHCQDEDPFLLCSEATPRTFATFCPGCELIIATAESPAEAVNDHNDHVIARRSGGIGD